MSGSAAPSRFRVRAAGPLVGTVRAAGMTKNAGCKQLAAALLAPTTSTVRNLHPVADLDVMVDPAGSYVIVVAQGDEALEPVHPRRMPFGVTNPIFLQP